MPKACFTTFNTTRELTFLYYNLRILFTELTGVFVQFGLPSACIITNNHNNLRVFFNLKRRLLNPEVVTR